MPNISLRVTEQDKELITNYAKFYGKNISNLFKELFIEKLENEEDLKFIEEYEKNPSSEPTRSLAEVIKNLEIGEGFRV